METNQLLINYYKKEEIKKVKQRQMEGLSNNEIINLANKTYITEEEIKQLLGIENEEKNINDESDFIIEDEEIENNKIFMINEKNLENYPNQPFSLYEGDKKKEMIESIKLNGIMQPLIVRPLSNGKYQILAGHNRRMCAKEIGINELFNLIIKNNLSEDEAKIYLIDTNLCTRDNISPIEKAKAYRIKYDTYKKRKIQTSVIEEIKRDNNGLRAELAREEKTSNGTIQRYLRLTYLIPELQELIEQGKLSINLGEKISFIPNEEQKILNEMILNKEIKLNEKLIRKIRNTLAIKKLDKPGQHLSKEEIIDVIGDKSKIKLDIIENITITFSKEEVMRYFRDYKYESEIKAYIVKKLENT